MRIGSLTLLAATAALLAGGCVNRAAQQQAKQTEALIKDPTVPVTLEPARTETLTDTLDVTGELATSDDTSVGARVAGRLVSVLVHDGSSVSAGQVIAQQDASMQRAQVDQASGQVAAARAALSQAMTNAQIGPQKTASAVATAEAQLRSAKAQLAKARAGARDEEVAQAKAQMSSAKSAMETAKKERDRAKTLYDQGAGSQQRYESAENAYQASLSTYEAALENLRIKQNWTRPEDLATAEEAVRQAEEAVRNAKAQQKLDALLDQQVAQARANLKAAEAGLAMANQSLSDTQVRSPFSGRVFGRPLQPGTFLNPGMEVARIIGSGGVFFEGEIPETVVPRIKPGDSVQISLDALPGVESRGEVLSISPSSTEVARTFRVRIGMASTPEGAKPGMFAKGRVVLRTIEDAVLVPQRAVVTEGGQTYVFTVEGGKAKRMKVATGISKDGMIQVLGLAAGSKIVTDGAGELTDGRDVKVDEGKKMPASADPKPGSGESIGA